MLVIGRRSGDGILLTMSDGQCCLVRVVQVRSAGWVRLGFECPASVAIDRIDAHESDNVAPPSTGTTGTGASNHQPPDGAIPDGRLRHGSRRSSDP